MSVALQQPEPVTERAWNVEARPFQLAFIESKARFPSMVCGWGTGKSMCLIIKGCETAYAYSNNLVLIVRHSFTDLRDSTMRDFTRYTGIEIPSNKDVRLANDSTIMFRHGSELATLQNINLGAFLIEQAEEFDSAGEFHLLRGRLRREGVPHFGAVIANAHGHNWIWNLWERHNPQRSSEYQQWYATTFDNAKNLPADFLEDLKRMKLDSPTKYQQYVMNSRDELDVEGSYYAKLIGQARVSDPRRITNVPHESAAQVYTFWDLGISDSTAIWFVQFIRKEIRVIDYYENSGEPLAHYAKVLQDKPYIYAENGHWGPHDLRGRSLQTGLTTLDVARQLGLKFQVLNQYRVQDGIEAARGTLPKCWFDETKCQAGIEALEHYQRRKNEQLSTDEKRVFSDTPLHDWSSHAADAFRYLAMAFCYELIVDRQRIGYPYPVRAVDDSPLEDEYDALRFGLKVG